MAEFVQIEEQQTTITGELTQTETIKLTVESEMPIEDLRKLYTSSTSITNVPTPKQEDTSSSDEDSTDDDDDGYQRLLIVEHPQTNENGEENEDGGSGGGAGGGGDDDLSVQCQKTVNIGENYQAIVPDLLSELSDQNSAELSNDQLLWTPPLDANNEENSILVNKYLKQAAKEFRTADQEVVLEIFLSTNYNIDQALDKLRLPSTNKNYFMPVPWTLPECDQFEQCFKDYGKDFSLFKIPNRSTNELIYFYYIWKKSARHDVFVRQNRVEKRRFHLHPYVTDYLEKFFAEQELQLTTSYEQSTSNGLPTLNPILSGEQLVTKRRLSSDLFLKPVSTIKRPKQLLNSNETNEQNDLLDQPQINTD